MWCRLPPVSTSFGRERDGEMTSSNTSSRSSLNKLHSLVSNSLIVLVQTRAGGLRTEARPSWYYQKAQSEVPLDCWSAPRPQPVAPTSPHGCLSPVNNALVASSPPPRNTTQNQAAQLLQCLLELLSRSNLPRKLSSRPFSCSEGSCERTETS